MKADINENQILNFLAVGFTLGFWQSLNGEMVWNLIALSCYDHILDSFGLVGPAIRQK